MVDDHYFCTLLPSWGQKSVCVLCVLFFPEQGLEGKWPSSSSCFWITMFLNLIIFKRERKLKLNQGFYLAISQIIWFKTWTLSWHISPLALSKQMQQEACSEDSSALAGTTSPWEWWWKWWCVPALLPGGDRFILNFPWGEILPFLF